MGEMLLLLFRDPHTTHQIGNWPSDVEGLLLLVE